MKKNKGKNINSDQKNIVKWLRVIIVLCIAIIVIELGYIGLSYYIRSKSIIYSDTLNNFSKVNDGYLLIYLNDQCIGKKQLETYSFYHLMTMIWRDLLLG